MESPENKPELPVPEIRGGEWARYEDTKTTGVIKSEFDQKVYILDVPTRSINFNDLMTLVTKELDTSFINDMTDKNLYQIQFENILEWANMGLFELARIRLSKLFGELKLEKSVGGFERIMQGSTLTGNVVASLPTRKQLFPLNIIKPKEKDGVAGVVQKLEG